ncbi:MAG: hypothetical protein ACFFCW_42085 [Candidatus Hodarchaeota archaeon]
MAGQTIAPGWMAQQWYRSRRTFISADYIRVYGYRGGSEGVFSVDGILGPIITGIYGCLRRADHQKGVCQACRSAWDGQY